MSKLWVRHVQKALKTGFNGLIPLSDYANANDSVREKAFLSRALAALAIQRFTSLSSGDAAQTVVDGTGDNGIDAIAFDEAHDRVIVVQSKWDGSGRGTLGLGDARNFLAGFKDLLHGKYGRFTPRLQRQRDRIETALDNLNIRFVLVVATTGATDLSKPARSAFDDELQELNDPQEMVELELMGLNEFHALVAEGLNDPQIDLTVTLENWGTMSEPYEAYYGVVAGSDIAGWYEKHNDRLFSQNIRKSLGSTPVNELISATAIDQPYNFWYFNNGVTALCETIRKSARGATSRTYGNFTISGISVVNGAQTVASIHRAARHNLEAAEQTRIWVRFISLEGCPPDFGAEVTRATNTQNAVESRDFVALDHEQSRLRTELVITLSKTYSIKRGEQVPDPDHGCTVLDATVAIACAQRDPQLAVLAKSSVGRLWESIDKAPYRTLFNPSTSPYRVWRFVEVMRHVDSTLSQLQQDLEGRPRSVARQGNRLILHLVFRGFDLHRVDDPDYNWNIEMAKIPALTEKTLTSLIDQIEDTYANNYLTSLFKNITKCRDVAEKVRAQLES
jgi:AIPR protein